MSQNQSPQRRSSPGVTPGRGADPAASGTGAPPTRPAPRPDGGGTRNPSARRPPEPPPTRQPARQPGGQPGGQPGRDLFPFVMGGIIGALFAALVFVLLLLQNNNQAPAPAAAPAPTTVIDTGSGAVDPGGAITVVSDPSLPGTAIPSEGTTHVAEGEPITYTSYPASSGTHYASVSTYGFFDTQVPDGKLVHNLEHGAIVLYYKPDLPSDTIAGLRDLLTTLPPSKYGSVKLVVTPNPKLQAALQVTAWGRALILDGFDLEQIRGFYTALVDKGPDDVP